MNFNKQTKQKKNNKKKQKKDLKVKICLQNKRHVQK